MIYLATPYSDPDPKVRKARFEAVNKAAACLMNKGYYVFSPISHSHPIALAEDLPLGWGYWGPYDENMIRVCERFMIFTQTGWRESTGVTAERKIALKIRRKIEYLSPSEVLTAKKEK